MSRIILSKYDNGGQHIVVGWDPPLNTFYWQEFNREPSPDPESGEVDWEYAYDNGWEEIKGFAGYDPREIQSTNALRQLMPEEHRNLLTKDVEAILLRHADDPGSGRIPPIDWTEREDG